MAAREGDLGVLGAILEKRDSRETVEAGLCDRLQCEGADISRDRHGNGDHDRLEFLNALMLGHDLVGVVIIGSGLISRRSFGFLWHHC